MNRRQRIAIFIGALVIALMLIFPPTKGWGGNSYGLFFRHSTYIAELDTRAKNIYGSNGWVTWQIDQQRLVFQILIVAVLTGGVIVLLGGKRNQ
jgi:hypothetical protein